MRLYSEGSKFYSQCDQPRTKHLAERMTRNMNALEQRLRHITDRYPFAVHWHVRDIRDGQHTGTGATNVVGAFSTRKVSVLLACLALVHDKKLSLDDTFEISEDLKDGVQSGVMRNVAAGIRLSLRDHLAQMMITSDNICTQLVFEAIERCTGDALQWVNDYCAQAGMAHTLHRETFPRTAELAWSHSIEAMTVTSPADQTLLLEQLARGCTDDDAAAALGLSSQLCALAVELMNHLFTPMLGARVTNGSVAEKNGRGIRSLSQVGILFNERQQAVASIAVFAEPIPAQLRDGAPGRTRALELFIEIGQALEEFFLDVDAEPVTERQVVAPDFWEQEFGELIYAVENGRTVNQGIAFTFSGIGKLLLAYTLNNIETQEPGLLEQTLAISDEHRARADTGSLRHLTGDLQVTVEDALRLILSSGDAAATLALLEHLDANDVDVVACGQAMVDNLPHTEITGIEQERSAGDGFTGTTTAADVLQLLRNIIDDDGRILQWMSHTFEPAGLASALPGYGPHTVEHWTISGWARLTETQAIEGRTSVLILNGEHGRFGVVAHAPVGTQDVPAKFGSLGLSTLADLNLCALEHRARLRFH